MVDVVVVVVAKAAIVTVVVVVEASANFNEHKKLSQLVIVTIKSCQRKTFKLVKR